MPRTKLDFAALESEINTLLHTACERMMSDAGQVEHYRSLFDRSSESGFYSGEDGPRGEGERPDWAPNPAYMSSLEKLWEPVAVRLESDGLTLEKSLRDLFFLSHEYRDRDTDHRRVFHGQLVDAERGVPVSYFLLSIPHSHEDFRYVTAPEIQISRAL